jgi:hypothetical protein
MRRPWGVLNKINFSLDFDIRLYIDGKLSDSVSAPPFPSKAALLRGQIIHDSKTYVIEVYLSQNKSLEEWKRGPMSFDIYIDGVKHASA